eukprot:TRINITY_DN3754_c0_g1_i1.p1 TRINITY_DN3754_c0_g1~~TRINITY_DN3754_c0_g1_i1.p1  ORF type:complete len:131 (+),score=34.01 TRINITY_DN3754_c0_g1_i1:160-552(+)
MVTTNHTSLQVWPLDRLQALLANHLLICMPDREKLVLMIDSEVPKFSSRVLRCSQLLVLKLAHKLDWVPAPHLVCRDASALRHHTCLLYTSDAADDLLCVDLGGRRIIKKKKEEDIEFKKRMMNRREIEE